MEKLPLEIKIGTVRPDYVCRGYSAVPSVELMCSSYEETSVSKKIGEHEVQFTIKYDDRNLEIEYLPDIGHYALPAEVPSLLMLSFIDAVHEVAQNFCQQRGKGILHHDASFPVFQALTWSL